MANLLKMAIVESILSLHAQGWSQRRIARELDVDRETVGKYVRQRVVRGKTSQPADRLGRLKTSQFCRACRLPIQNQPPTCRPARSTAENRPTCRPARLAAPVRPASASRTAS